MRYKPRPTPGAVCYDGLLALRGFGPNPADAADVLEACAMPCTSREQTAYSLRLLALISASYQCHTQWVCRLR